MRETIELPSDDCKPGEPCATLRIYRPTVRPSGAAALIFPGGGYIEHAPHEAVRPARWLAGLGITAFVVQYRLAPRHRHPAQWNDGRAAMRWVRCNARQFEIDPSRVGVVGFSAGGHLAAMLATEPPAAGDRETRAQQDANGKDLNDVQPDFAVLVYPVASLMTPTQGGTRRHLMGDAPDTALLAQFSAECRVEKLPTGSLPPIFLVHCKDDASVDVSRSDVFAAAVRKISGDIEYRREHFGGHGVGLQPGWTEPCERWLRERGLTTIS